MLPKELMHPIEVIGHSNTFLCMFVIGVALNFAISLEKIKRIFSMIIYRYSLALIAALIVWFTLPFAPMVRLVIVAICFAPITSLAPITAIKSLPQFAEDSANLNMISVITSVVIVTIINAFASLMIS